MKAQKPSVEPLMFSLDMGVDCEEFKQVPEWQQKLVKECHELNSAPQVVIPTKPAAPAPEVAEDDIPF